jgi:hypothetical protein
MGGRRGEGGISRQGQETKPEAVAGKQAGRESEACAPETCVRSYVSCSCADMRVGVFTHAWIGVIGGFEGVSLMHNGGCMDA